MPANSRSTTSDVLRAHGSVALDFGAGALLPQARIRIESLDVEERCRSTRNPS